ncbi:hypothetical protein DEIGR_200002 [Deinococcus grandis]|uniref:ABC3 transporter permease C-terminal domain-containing protein n=1 Tax=Deinococcus grandis TaxID=57498 RepID=A0A124BS37_9DEIO|nr:ABC transporter permease [Deinococcus grandis]BBN96544.1 hypothetical protein DEGR_32770 [Deinococcus grandis]GAQ23147.1 hypothetical protein DEIGR_200002 [Deinococcus grandis]
MYLALRELTHHRLRSLLVGGIVALIAFMVFMLTGLTRGLAHDNAALLIETPATHFVTTQDAEGVFSRSFITTSDLRALTGTLGPDATPLAQTFTSLSAHTRQLSAVLIGVDPRGFLAPAPTQGAPLSTGNGAVVDESLQGDGVRLGDTLTLRPGGETVQVTGFTRSARLNHQPVIFIDLDRWHALNPRATGTVNAVALRGPAATLPATLTQRTRAQTLQALPGYREEQGSLTMIQGFLIVVAAFVMAAFFYVLTLQKTPQFGLLKAIGASTRTLAAALVTQMLLLTALATAAATLGTLGATALLPEGLPFTLTPGALLGASGLLIAVAALSSLLSLRRIAHVDPLIAIGAAS